MNPPFPDFQVPDSIYPINQLTCIPFVLWDIYPVNNSSKNNSNEPQTVSPAQNHTEPTHTRSSRGKIARLPHLIREELNIRLDDGQTSSEILEWLNNLPKVRLIMERLYKGILISPQNLSAWRNGGYQEWLHLTHFFDSAIQMREQIQVMQKEFSASNPGEVPRSMAEYMLTYLSVRFAAFMNRWDGSASPDHDALLKTATIIIKMQAAAINAERATLEFPKLREKAFERHQEHAMSIAELQTEEQRRNELEEEGELRELKRKSRNKTSSSSIKVKKGSEHESASASEPLNPPSEPFESTQPAVIENVNFTPPPSLPEPTESTPTLKPDKFPEGRAKKC
jgi:hypothetical protein